LSTQQTNSYKVEELRTIKDLRDIYNEYEVKDAWLFLSLGAFHGTELTLDDLELILADQSNISSSVNGRFWVSVLVVFPKLTSAHIMNYADILIDADDVQWLREKVRETLREVEASQYGNT
jgi:hypothetical protein